MTAHAIAPAAFAIEPEVEEARARKARRWLLVNIVVQFTCQLMLLTPTFASLRILLRTAAFATSIFSLALVAGNGKARPPAAPLMLGVMAIMVLGLAHPSTNGLLAGLAETGLYLAILAPVFWVPRLDLRMSDFRLLLHVLWFFYFASSFIGALQVYYPGSFTPEFSTTLSADYIESLQITLASGERIFRPSGLTDTPGGAGIGAMYCIILGTGLMMDKPRAYVRPLIIGGMGVAMFTLSVCQVRSLLVIMLISVACTGGALLAQGKVGRFTSTFAVLAAIGVAGLVAAVAMGGESVTNRLGTLVETDAKTLYATNRGIFLEQTFTELLPEYPLGAGLGRFGMMGYYFGNGTSSIIYAELQWTAWLLDGGFPLMVLYSTAVGVVGNSALQLTRSVDTESAPIWGAVFFGYTVGTFASMFNAGLFMGSMGLEFWLLTTALYCAAHGEREHVLQMRGLAAAA